MLKNSNKFNYIQADLKSAFLNLGTILGTKQKKRKCNYLKFNNLQILFCLKSGVGGIRTLVQTSNT